MNKRIALSSVAMLLLVFCIAVIQLPKNGRNPGTPNPSIAGQNTDWVSSLQQKSPTAAQSQDSDLHPTVVMNADGSFRDKDIKKAFSRPQDELMSEGQAIVMPVQNEPEPIPGQKYYQKKDRKLIFGTIAENGDFIPAGAGDIDISTRWPMSIHYPILREKQERKPSIFTDSDGRRYESYFEPGKPIQIREIK